MLIWEECQPLMRDINSTNGTDSTRRIQLMIEIKIFFEKRNNIDLEDNINFFFWV